MLIKEMGYDPGVRGSPEEGVLLAHAVSQGDLDMVLRSMITCICSVLTMCKVRLLVSMGSYIQCKEIKSPFFLRR